MHLLDLLVLTRFLEREVHHPLRRRGREDLHEEVTRRREGEGEHAEGE
eukprot:COSAG01_NODE_50197_length_365_cov_0.951128_1_plen_47_part_10